MKQISVFILVLVVSIIQAQTSKTDPYFSETRDTVSTRGPISITRYILEDKKGNIWLASWQGIMKYDGKVFTNYTLKQNLIHFHVYSIMEDRSGNIWFGTIRGGAYKYDGKNFTLFTTEDGLADDLIGNMMEDKNGNIWFGTDNGISRLDTSVSFQAKSKSSVTLSGWVLTTKKGFNNFTTHEGLCGDRVNSIIQDKTGKMWIGTRSGVSCYDGTTFTNFTMASGQAFTNVRSIKEDKSGKIWLGGQEGLYCYDPNNKSLSQLMPNFIGHIFEDKAGHLWMNAGEKSGMALYRYDGKSFDKILEKKGQDDFQIFEITEDTNGNIWFGTMKGPCCYNGKTFRYFTE